MDITTADKTFIGIMDSWNRNAAADIDGDGVQDILGSGTSHNGSGNTGTIYVF